MTQQEYDIDLGLKFGTGFRRCGFSVFRAVIAPSVISIVLVLIGYFVWKADATVTGENRLLENGQVFFLFIASAAHFFLGRTSPGPVSRFGHFIAAALFLSVMVRELDIDRFGPQAGWELVESVIRLGIVVLWILLAIASIRHWRLFWSSKISLVFSTTSVPIAIGIFLYLLSWLFDKSVIGIAPSASQLAEELLQLSATVFFLASAGGRLPD